MSDEDRPQALSEEELQNQLAAIDEQLAKFEQQKRWSDYIRTLIKKAELVSDPSAKVELYTRAGTLYIERSSNQAEAIKCFEAVRSHEPHNTEAILRLREMYEKRRDWEKLIGVLRAEADLLDPDDRPLRYVEMAQLATQRLRKPEICIELWEQVLGYDPENPEALSALIQLHERARNWEPLAHALEKRLEQVNDEKELTQQLQKLGMIYADKIGDDEGAIRAFRQLLTLDPTDRRAQEQLKRRYVALKAWDQLEGFYGSTQKWDELIRIFEREADGDETSREERIELLFRAARLWEQEKGKPERAARAYEKILESDPDNLRAAEALSPIYENARDPRKLVAVYEVRLRHIEDPDERLQLLRETGLLYEERLRDPELAFERFLNAFATDPLQEVVREDVERLAPKVEGGWDRVIGAYRSAVDRSNEESDGLSLRLHLGRALREVGRVDEAIEQYRAMSELRGDHPAAIQALAELYRETGRSRELLQVYEQKMQLETDSDARREIAYQRAAILEAELEDHGAAIDAYRTILEEYGPDEANAFRALDQLYEKEGRWEEFVATLERRIELGPDSEDDLIALKYRMGRALEQHLENKPRSVELYREVLTLQPQHDEATQALETLLSDSDVGGRAAEILEPVYEERGDWASLITALQVLHAHSGDATYRLELLTKIGEIREVRLGDGAASFEAFSQALREAPHSEETLGRLEILAVEHDRFRDLVTLISELAGQVDDPNLSRALWIKAAETDEVQLQDIEGAVAAYRKVLDLEPGDVDVLNALEQLYRRTERWRDLQGILRRRAELTTESEERELLLAQMAFIHDEMLESPEEAISLYNEMLELNPASARALSALDDLYARLERWSDLADNVDRQLTLTSEPDQQVALMLRLAELRETRMGAVEAAIEGYREILDRDPTNEHALTALERLIETEAHQVLIADILEPIYRDAGQYQQLIAIYEIQAHHAGSASRRVELLHKIAELYELAIDDAASAFNTFARALAEDPASESTQDNLARLAAVTGNYEALAAVYEQRTDAVEDPILAANLHAKAAAVREEQLGDAETAIAHYRRVLELDGQQLEAATALEGLFQRSERYGDLAEIYLQKSRALTNLDDQKDYLFRAASIFEDVLEEPERAVTVYSQVLDTDPDDVRALDKLIELYLRMENWESLLEVYTRKADIVVDVDEKKRLYVEMGAVYEREVGRTDKAIDAYQRILELDPEDLTAIGRLDALYQATENWQELLSVLEREADLASDPHEVISYRYRIAELWHLRLDDPLRAIDIYRDILEVIPEHGPTLASLESMIAEGREAMAAANVLEPVFRQAGEWEKLVRVHEVQVAHDTDDLRRVEILHQVAELLEEQLGRPADAFHAFARAFPIDVENDHTLVSLERLAQELGTWSEVTQLYDQAIEKLRSEAPESVVDLALRAAQVYELQLSNVEAAIDHYRVVLDVDSAHAQAVEALDRLYESTGRWQDLTGILRREIEYASMPDQILNFQFRLGRVYQEQLGDVEHAIEQYREILAVAPEHNAAASSLELLFADGVKPLVIGEILEPLYRMQESWDRLVNVHELQLVHQPEPTERVSMMHRIAEIAEDRMVDHERAFAWQQKALLEDPAHDHTQAEVERLAKIVDGWGQLAHTYADVLQNGGGNGERSTVGRRLARVYQEELGDIQSAEETYRYLLGIDQGDDATLVALDSIYSEYGAHEALAEVLKRRIGSATHPDDRVELSFRLGQVLEVELGRTDEAIQTYDRILADLEPEHRESIQSLERIYVAREDWANLFRAYERELNVAGGDSERSDTYAKMARIAAGMLSDSDRAIQLWKQVIELRGEDPEALNALGDIYAEQENWQDLVDVLDREVSTVDDDAQRIAIYSDLGRIWYEKLSRAHNALDSWERVLDIDPGNTNGLFAIADIHRAAQQPHELVDTLNRIIEVGSATLDDSRLEAVYTQLGSLYRGELQQPLDAVDSYNRALTLNPANFAAMDALEEIHRAEGMWEDCIRVMERRAEALAEPSEKIPVLLAVAEMWAQECGDADQGTSAFQRILEHDPNHGSAFESLEELHRAAMRWEDLIELYLMRVETTEDARYRIELLGKIAKVYEQELDDKEQAFEALTIAWSEDYSDAETSAELERVTGAINKWNELLTLANGALQEATDPETKIAICLHCARWYGQELGHPEYAIPYYQQIQQLEPGNVASVRQLAELYRTTKQWQLLAQTLGQVVQLTDDPVIKAETYVKMGDLCRENLGVPEQAAGYYQRALDENASSVGALEALEQIYRDQEQWDLALEMLHRKVEALTDTDELLAAQLRLAETYEDRAGDPERAIEIYRKALELDSVNSYALKGLERLYAQTGRWQELQGILEAEYEVAATEKERIDLLSRLASIWEEQFLKAEKAADCLEQVLEIDPLNEPALHSLERLYQQMQRWDELAQTYERHINAVSDRGAKVGIFKAMGDVFALEIGDQDRAVDSYLAALDVDESDLETLDALTRLYDRRGEHGAALEMMERMAGLVREPEQQVDLRFRMGRILDEQLGDRAGAAEHFQSAIDLDPEHLPSLEALRKIYVDSGDWLAAARVLEQESQYQQSPRLSAQLLVELGQILDERLEEHEQAVEMFTAAYDRDPDNEDAALPLAEHFVAQQHYDGAFPLLEMLVKRSGKRPPDEQHRLAFMLGEVSSQVGQDDEAIRAFAKAHEIDTSHLPSLLGLAASHYRKQDWSRAFKFYQMLLVHHRDSLGADEITDVFYRLGVIKREQGERRKALNMFDKALEEDQYHRPSLEAVISLCETQNDWEQVIHFKKQILEVAETEDERFSILEQIGDLWKDRLKNQQRAIQAYSDAVDVKPEDHKVLHKLLVAFQESKQWHEAIDVIQRISDLDDRAAAKAKYAYTVAVIIRDELKDSDGAIDKFNESLDLDSSQLKAFEAINKILTQRKDWKQLERAFRKMLHRVVGQGNTELEFNLWHNLGVIYRDRQNQYEEAAGAFAMASQLQPENALEHQILAELYSMIPEKINDAIAEHQWMLRNDPYKIDSYRALYQLYFDARAYDKAWCLAATLAFLKKADSEQQQFYEQYRQTGMIRPQSRIDNDRWVKNLFHPSEDLYVSKIFEALGPAVHAAKASTDKALHLYKKHEVDPATSTVTFARTFGFVSQVLNLTIVPRLFLRPDAQGGLTFVPGSNPPASVCGASLLSGFSPQDLTFVVARHAAYYRGEHFIRTMLNTHTELRSILLAALTMAGVGPQDPQLASTVQALRSKLGPAQFEAVRSIARKFVEAGGNTDLKKWMQAVELTGVRAGFLLCNDLETAARMIQSLPPEGPTDLPAKDKIKEVVLFSVSEEYFALRESLGIQIQV